MKIAGWIILALGILSFTGAALASHSVFRSPKQPKPFRNNQT